MTAPLSTLLTSVRKSRKAKAQHINRAGAPSFRRSLKEQVVAVLSTGTLGDTYYVSRKEICEEAIGVLTEARNQCPEFLAKALVWARNKGMLKTLPVLGLVVLSAGGSKTKVLFGQTFPHVVKTPDDLRSFVMICKSGAIPGRKGLGGMTVSLVKAFLLAMSEYHTVKYGSSNSREITLRDIIRMAHPNPGSPEVAERLGWLVRGRRSLGINQDYNRQIRSLEALKMAPAEDAQLALIREGRLPYEVVVPSLKATSTAIWRELLRQAPYLNLLRNLNTFTRHQVFSHEEEVGYVVKRLTDPIAVRRSKVLPFRFFNAWQAYMRNENHDSRIANALRAALELSFANMPSFGNRVVAIGTDVSGSMNSQVSDKGSTRFIDIAGIFTGALLKRIENRAVPLPFETRVRSNNLSSRDDIMVSADKIAQMGGGGTAVGAPIEYLLDRKIKVDVFIGITDNEDWAYGEEYSCSGSFLELWRRYRKEIAPEAQAFLVTIASYRDAVAPEGEDGVHFIYGWSDRVLDYIGLTLESGSGQIQAIEQVELWQSMSTAGPHSEDSEHEQAQTDDE